MNTHTFDNHYVTCPICQRNNKTKAVKIKIGLFTCPHCQERFVVCKSGHYVRDPFTWKQIVISSTLRRQSQPLARIIRDFVLFKRPLIALAMGSAILLTMMAVTQDKTSFDSQLPPGTERTSDTGKDFIP